MVDSRGFGGALAIASLTFVFACWRWRLPIKARWSAAVVAAIFTNPAYVMIIEVFHYQNFLESVFAK